MITTQQMIPGINTNSQPAVAANGDKYVLAWTNTNGSISWTTLSVNQDQDGYVTNKITATGFSTATAFNPLSWGPALANLGGTVWMAWLENAGQAPPIPPYDQTLQPPVIMVSSLNGSTWSPAQPVWNPGLIGLDHWAQGFQGPAAVSAPAIAATASELFLAWCEYATNGSDALALYYEGVDVSPFPQTQIFFSKWRNGKGWTPRLAVVGALTQRTPALVGYRGVVYMAWRGQSDNNIWFAQYTDDSGWSASAELPGFKTSAGPALGVGDTDNVHLVWKGQSDSNIFGAKLSGTWSPQNPGKGWSPETQFPVVATGLQPALASQLSASTDILLAWTGATTQDLYVIPLDAFGPAPAPPAPGLEGVSNYILCGVSNCQLLNKVVVTIDVSEDIVCSLGFTIQLNANAPLQSKNFNNCSWQQCGFEVDPNGNLGWWVNNYTPSHGPSIQTPSYFMVPLGAPTIPKGYKLTISLDYDNNLNVTGASFGAPNGGPISPLFAFPRPLSSKRAFWLE